MPPKGSKKTKAPKTKAPKKQKVSAPVKQYIAKQLEGETKMSSLTYTITGFNSQILSVADIIPVLPPVLQGVTQKARIGQKITPLKLEIRGYVIYNAPALIGNYDAKFIGGRLFVYQDKANKCYTQSSVDNYNLLNLGGTSSTFTGQPMDYITPHNNLLFKFYSDKRFKFLKPIGLTNNSSPSVTNGLSECNNTLFHPFLITITQKDLPVNLIYDEYESASYPINFAPKLSLGYVDLLNGASPDIVNQQLAMQFCSTLYYKDT